MAPQPPRPGIIPLRPLGVTEILDGAVRCVRSYPRVSLGASAAVTTGVSLVVGLLVWLVAVTAGLDLFEANMLTSPGGFVLSVVSGAILAGLLTVVTSRGVLGAPTRLADAWATLRPRVRPLIGVLGLLFLIRVGVIVLGALPGLLALAVGAPGWVIVLLFVVGVLGAAVADVYLVISLGLAIPAAVLEGQPPRAALGRSRLLVSGDWWRVFGTTLLAQLITQVVAFVIAIPFVALALLGGAVLTADTDGETMAVAFVVAGLVGGLVAQTLSQPFLIATQTLIYVDRRMRREGLDLDLARVPATTASPDPGPGSVRQW